MGNLHLVTGYAGQEHITATDQGAFNAALIGTGQFVLAKGNEFAAQIISNNVIRVKDGELMMQGRFVRREPDTYVDLTIENGAQGMKRNDLIVARYTKSTTTGIEEVNLVVIKGTAVASNPVDPAYTVGDITNGEAVRNDFPLWRIPINGLNVGTPVMLFEPFIDSMRTLPDIRNQVNQIHSKVNAQLAEQDAEIDKKIAELDEYTKNEVLTNETKAMYGLANSAVPNDAFVAIKHEADSKGRIETFSYTGDGKFGVNHPNSLAFDFVPKLLILVSTSEENANTFWPQYDFSPNRATIYMDLVGTSYGTYCGFCDTGLNNNNGEYSFGKKSADGKTLTWYNNVNAVGQCNKAGVTYYGIAFG